MVVFESNIVKQSKNHVSHSESRVGDRSFPVPRPLSWLCPIMDMGPVHRTSPCLLPPRVCQYQILQLGERDMCAQLATSQGSLQGVEPVTA